MNKGPLGDAKTAEAMGGDEDMEDVGKCTSLLFYTIGNCAWFCGYLLWEFI